MEKCLLGKNVTPDIFYQKSKEKSKLRRNISGRNVFHPPKQLYKVIEIVPNPTAKSWRNLRCAAMAAFSSVCRIIFPFVIQMTQRLREQRNHKLQRILRTQKRLPQFCYLTTNVGEEDNHKSKLLTSCFRPISWQPQKSLRSVTMLE